MRKACSVVVVLAAVFGHAALVLAVRLTDRWIEFTPTYWCIAVPGIALPAIAIEGVLLLAGHVSSRSAGVTIAAVALLGYGHDRLIELAAWII